MKKRQGIPSPPSNIEPHYDSPLLPILSFLLVEEKVWHAWGGKEERERTTSIEYATLVNMTIE